MTRSTDWVFLDTFHTEKGFNINDTDTAEFNKMTG